MISKLWIRKTRIIVILKLWIIGTRIVLLKTTKTAKISGSDVKTADNSSADRVDKEEKTAEISGYQIAESSYHSAKVSDIIFWIMVTRIIRRVLLVIILRSCRNQ